MNKSPPLTLHLNLSHPQGQTIDVKCEKSHEIGNFEFLNPVLNLSENWLLITCIGLTNLSRIHEKLLQLSRPQGRLFDVKLKKLQLGYLKTNSAII